MADTLEIPFELKKSILELAKKLPEAGRSQFVKNTTERLGELVLDHPKTLIYSTAGWVLGQVIDDLLIMNIPMTDIVIALTDDRASNLGLVSGALFGFYNDIQKQAERKRIAAIVGEELRRSSAK